MRAAGVAVAAHGTYGDTAESVGTFTHVLYKLRGMEVSSLVLGFVVYWLNNTIQYKYICNTSITQVYSHSHSNLLVSLPPNSSRVSSHNYSSHFLNLMVYRPQWPPTDQ